MDYGSGGFCRDRNFQSQIAHRESHERAWIHFEISLSTGLVGSRRKVEGRNNEMGSGNHGSCGGSGSRKLN